MAPIAVTAGRSGAPDHQTFVEQRGRDKVYRPDALRAQAVDELRFALSQDLSRTVPGSWVSLGPKPMNMLSWAMGRVAGRVSAFAVSPATEQTLYLGTASGGLWKTTNGGTSWSSIFDAIGTQTIGSLAIDPNNTDTVWVGTGEQRQSCLSYSGMGLFRSTDGGQVRVAPPGRRWAAGQVRVAPPGRRWAAGCPMCRPTASPSTR